MTQSSATDVTLGELARAMSRLDTQMQSVGAQVAQVGAQLAQVASDVRVVRTQFDAHVDRQAERTTARDQQVNGVRAESEQRDATLRAEHDRDVAEIAKTLKEIRGEQQDTARWRWSIVGKWTGFAAGAGVAGGGTAAALMKVLGA